MHIHKIVFGPWVAAQSGHVVLQNLALCQHYEVLSQIQPQKTRGSVGPENLTTTLSRMEADAY